MRVLVVLGLVGQLLRGFCLAFIAPIALALYERAYTSAVQFVISLAAMFTVGTLLGAKMPKVSTLHRAEALAVVSSTWLVLGVFCAVPYVLNGLHPVDALFESVSGLTTTGATILADFTRFDRSFFLWRAMTQWFGGLGIIALFVVVLPRLGIAGRQLFFAEASGAQAEGVSPQIRKNASRLWILYAGMTVVLSIALTLCGYPVYDAVCHALTTISAGGFSPHPQSIMGYANPKAEWVLTLFMLLAGASFALLFRVLTGRAWALVRDAEFRLYAGVTLAIGLGLAVLLSGGLPSEESLRLGLFQAASLISSTGFASADYQLWGPSLKVLLILAMVVGGCAGSAAGGPKAVRILLVVKHVVREITLVLHPRAVLPIKYHGRPVSRDVMRSVFTLVVLYYFGYFVVGVLLVLMGSDLVVGFSAAIACFGNVGPAFEHAGPMGSFAEFSKASKLLLAASMWLGRLEIVTVLALLHQDVWRNLRLR